MGIIVKNGVEYGASVDLSSLQSAYTRAQVDTIVADRDYSPTENAHSNGDYLIADGTFYKALRSIGTNELLEDGTNVESTNIGDELSKIWTSLSSILTRLQNLESGAIFTNPTLSIENDLLSGSNSLIENDMLVLNGISVGSDDIIG